MKYRHVYIASVLWVVLIFVFFQLKRIVIPVYCIHSVFDDYVPFFKWAVFAYMLWYFYLFASLLYFGIVYKPDFIKLQTAIFTGMGFCFVVYAVFPNMISFRPEITGNDTVSTLVRFLYSIDSPNMVIPSMHVFDAVIIHMAVAAAFGRTVIGAGYAAETGMGTVIGAGRGNGNRNKNRRGRRTKSGRMLVAVSFVIMVLICASTVLVKQHSIIDVFTGIALAFAVYYAVYKPVGRWYAGRIDI